MITEIWKVAAGPDLEFAIVENNYSKALALECFLTPDVLIFLPRKG